MKQNNGNFEVDLLSTIYQNNNKIKGWVSEIRKEKNKILEKIVVGV